MTSSLYDCTVMHHRLRPVRHRFVYRLFMFCLDLDEIDSLAARSWFMSRNRWNLFSFRDSDHLQRGHATVRENLIDLIRSRGITEEIGKIYLITHLRTLGYVFNPVSFYYVFDTFGTPLCAVAEVHNTYREQKNFIARPDARTGDTFRMMEQKFFYVSPFVDLDAFMDFRMKVPTDQLRIRIDDVQHTNKLIVTTLTGERKPVTDRMLLWYALRFPLVTVQVIFKIHWQALLLYVKGLPYHPKNANHHLQKEYAHAKR